MVENHLKLMAKKDHGKDVTEGYSIQIFPLLVSCRSIDFFFVSLNTTDDQTYSSSVFCFMVDVLFSDSFPPHEVPFT